MGHRFSAATVLLFLIASLGCSNRFSSVHTVNTQSVTPQAERAIGNPAAFPTINPLWMKGARSPLQRARDIVVGASGGRLPRGTRLYATDVIAVRVGNHITLPSRTQTIRKRRDGRVVLLNAQGRVVEIFAPSAVIQRQKGVQVDAVFPGQPLPRKYSHSRPFETIN